MDACAVIFVGGSTVIIKTGGRGCANDVRLLEVVGCGTETVVGAIGPTWSYACCWAFA